MTTSVEVPRNPSAVEMTTAAIPAIEAAAPDLSRIRRFQDLCMVLLVALWLPLMGTVFVLQTGERIGSGHVGMQLAAQFVFEAVALAVLYYVLRRQGRGLRSIGLRFAVSDCFKGVGLWLAAYLAVILVWVPLNLTATSLGLNLGRKDVAALLGLKPTIWWFGMMLFNPWYEELIVRAYTMTEIEALTGKKWLAVMVSVGLQASYHAYQGGWNVVMLSITFLVMALYFARRHLALPVIVGHTIEDLLALVMAR